MKLTPHKTTSVIIPKVFTWFITIVHLLQNILQCSLHVFIAPPHTSEDLTHLHSCTQLVLGGNC